MALYEALSRHLPDGWSAFHSLKLRVGKNWEGEGDFVIAAPDRGLLVLEVKGGVIELEDGMWLQNGRKLDMAPREQARRFVRNLVTALAAKRCEVPPYGVACAFPDCEFSEGPRCGDLANIVIGQRDLSWLLDLLPSLMSRVLPDRPVPRDPGWIQVLRELWGDSWAPRIAVGDQAERAVERTLALDREQLEVLSAAEDNPRAIVRGGAGSGKTVLARELCSRRAAAGERALYLCFTDALASAVDCSFSEDRRRGAEVRAVPIRRYALELLDKAGHVTAPGARDFWDQVSLRAACDAIPAERPDIVVIDEAQDLDESDWLLVSGLADDRGLWVFVDERQGFWTGRQIPEPVTKGAMRLNLKAQLRNPEYVWWFASQYCMTAGEAVDKPKRDESVRVVVAGDDQDILKKVRHEITELRRGGVKSGDIVVLSLAGRAKSVLLRETKLGDHRLVPADAADAGENIVADTFLRFKGLERPFVILTELVRGNIGQYECRMHIAITRATAGVIVVCTEKALVDDPRLRELAK